ncbi:MAG: Unknown protein [uncultured Thiotrichaceae bacterium]|uniref:DUF481 domain-containing protein n=1 Tax=uncultured Thiotrichaceae bacterium TaxID=298394 RepID=A0A6S6TPB4_9GAMM|nr:MAG: Unknown protein [uncultured Thiotrichaceae bacterium]
MKKNIIALSVFSALSATSVAQAETVTLYDYDEATSAYEEAYFTGGLSVSNGRKDDQTAYDFSVGADYDRVFSSPSRDVTTKASVDGSISRAGTAGANKQDNYVAAISGTIDNYFTPGSNGAFWFGNASVRANDAFDDLETTASIGVGYGRVVNVTPMAKAIRVVEELVQLGVLRNTPAKSVYQQMANIIERESEYRSRYGFNEDYELKWITDILATLQTNISTAGTLKARDVLVDERISQRRYGWKVRAGLGYVGTNFDGLKDKPLLTAGAEYHQPLSNLTQFSNEATVNAIINDGDNGYNFNNAMSLTHEVDDRLDWENSWNLAYTKNTDNGDDVVTNSVASSLIYELNNTLDLTTTLAVQNIDGSSRTLTETENGVTTSYAEDGTDTSLVVGVRYRFK